MANKVIYEQISFVKPCVLSFVGWDWESPSLNNVHTRFGYFWIFTVEVTSVMPSILTSGLAIHKGTKCDDCNNNIVGLRFKCLDCPDFDLCSNCEPKNLHPGHLLVRIGTPIAVSQSKKKIVKKIIIFLVFFCSQKRKPFLYNFWSYNLWNSHMKFKVHTKERFPLLPWRHSQKSVEHPKSLR